MNPKIEDGMNWKDYTSTATQWMAILGGIIWAVMGGMGMAPGGPLPGASLAITGLAGGKKGSLLQDMLGKIVKGLTGGKSGTMAILIIATALIALQACGSTHPLLKPESRQAAMRVAAPYILSDCSAIELYAGYRFNWNQVDPNGDPDYLHGFGGIIGGCGKFAKIACDVTPACDDATGECSEQVICEVVQVLTGEEEEDDPDESADSLISQKPPSA